jgi:hypothetical protein
LFFYPEGPVQREIKPESFGAFSLRTEGFNLFSLKGWHSIAQGNALGSGQINTSSLKGWDKLTYDLVSALQAGCSNGHST